jgi:4-alpha-glucanotransferase
MRRAGIQLHPTSLPGPGPCGTLGASLRRWLDWLVTAECTLWQVLPLHPPGQDGSPYDSPSAFALDTRLIDIADLVDAGLLPRATLSRMPESGETIDAAGLTGWHQPAVAAAAQALLRDDPDGVEAFTQEQPWVREWARFRALVDAYGGRGWWDLPAAYQRRHEAALSAADRAHRSAIDQEVAAQLLVHRQWARVRKEASERGILIIGDLPIFVARDGAEPWQHRALFRLGDDGRPCPTTGAPPDDFSALGQAWNNPHYHWPSHADQDYRWWSDRFGAAMARHDVVRVDHFRGFVAAWEVPASGDARAGRWGPSPGSALLAAVAEAVPGLQAIAEDLGDINAEVRTLRRRLGWPGMKVLQFGFDGKPDNPHLPPWPQADWVATPGTHDNDTTVGWYETADPELRQRVSDLLGVALPCPDPAGALLRAAWQSEAQWAIATLQDVLRLGSWARMNTPGKKTGCWGWRARALPGAAAAELAELSRLAGRSPGTRGAPSRTEAI